MCTPGGLDGHAYIYTKWRNTSSRKLTVILYSPGALLCSIFCCRILNDYKQIFLGGRGRRRGGAQSGTLPTPLHENEPALLPLPPVPNLPPLTLHPTSAETIGWVSEYKYLGLYLRSDLSMENVVTRMKSTLAGLEKRMFHGTYIVRHMSPAMQIQLIGTLIQGAVSYLIGVIPITEIQAHSLDTSLRQAARGIIMTGNYTPNVLVSAETRLPTFWALAQQHRFRIYHSVRTYPTVVYSPAAIHRHPIVGRVLQILETEAVLPPPVNLQRHTCWITRKNQMDNSAATDNIQPPPVDLSQPWNIHKLASLHGTRIAYADWRREGLKNNAVHTSARPRSSAKDHAVDSHFLHNMTAMQAIPQSIKDPRHIPISIRGPGCTGSIFALTTIPAPKLTPLINFHLAELAMQLYPFTGNTIGIRGIGGFNEAALHEHPPCHLCGTPSNTPWHLLNECMHDSMLAPRDRIDAEIRLLIPHDSMLIGLHRIGTKLLQTSNKWFIV
jgi:hypothetical protein